MARGKMKKVYEDAPTVNVGGGDIAGAGVSKAGKPANWGEPGVSPRHQPKGSKTPSTKSVVMALVRRKDPNMVREGYSTYSGKSHSLSPFSDKRTDPLKNKRGADRTLGQYTRDFPANYAKKKISKELGDVKSSIKSNLGKHTKPKHLPENFDTFAGATVFEVSSSTFHNAKMEKRKGKHWRTYLDECDELTEIRDYANKNPGKPIVLRNRNTNEMTYVRYGRKG